MTRISIAMATYNGERYLGEQLDSFAAQTRLPDELVICDDGSSDGTLAIAENFASHAPFPVVISRNPERLGYSDNFARAIAKCGGDIIFLSDQDDVWFADKIATVAGFFAEVPEAQVVINDQVLTDEQLQHGGVTKLRNLRRVGKTSAGMIEGCCTALRRDWADALFPMPEDLIPLVACGAMSHDRWVNELAILLGRRAVVDRPLQYFRRTGSNVTSWILSEPRRPTLAARARERRSAAPVDAWRGRIEVLDSYERFIMSHRLAGDKARALRKIDHERSSHEQRIRLSGVPRRRRPSLVWRLWRSGGYRYFERWLSAANDLVRSAQ